jgi:hypothetical protein
VFLAAASLTTSRDLIFGDIDPVSIPGNPHVARKLIAGKESKANHKLAVSNFVGSHFLILPRRSVLGSPELADFLQIETLWVLACFDT